MKNNIMLSLLAMTSASVGAYANADMTAQIDVKDLTQWTSNTDGFSLVDGIITSPGAAISQEIGTLLPREYKLTWTDASENIKVRVNGAELKDNTFKLSSSASVTIRVESTDGKSFHIGGFKLELVFDFKAYQEKVQFNASILRNRLTGEIIANDPENEVEYAEVLDKVDALLERIANIKEDYASYKNEELYKTESKIDADLKTLGEEVEKAAQKAQNNADNKTAYDNATNVVKALTDKLNADCVLPKDSKEAKRYTADKNALAETLKDYQKEIDEALSNNTIQTDYTDKKLQDYKAARKPEINKLSWNIKLYKALIDSYEATEAAYNKYMQTDLQAVVTSIIGETVKPEIYNDSLVAAQSQMSKDYFTVKEAYKKIQSELIDITEGYQTTAEEQMSTATTAMENTYNRFKTTVQGHHANYLTAIAYVTSSQSKLDDVETALADVIDTYTEDIKKIQEAIDDLQKAIKSANSEHKFDLDGYEAIAGKIVESINELKTTAQPDILNYNAYRAVSTLIDEAQEAYDAAQETAEAAISADEAYTASAYFKGTSKEITEGIKAQKTDLGTAYTNKIAVQYQNDNSGKIKALKEKADTYKNNAVAMKDRYEKVAEALVAYNNAYSDLEKVVKNPSVTIGGGQSAKTYGTEMTRLQGAITTIQTARDNAKELTDQEHIEAMKAIELNDLIRSELEELAKSYVMDEPIYNKNVIAITIANITKENTDGIAAIKKDIELNEAEVGLSYTKLQEQADAITAALKTQEDKMAEITNQTAPADALSILVSVRNELSNIRDLRDEFKNAVTAAIDKVEANATAKTELDKEIADLRDQLTGNPEEEIYGVTALMKDPAKTAIFTTKTTAIDTSIDGIEKNIATSKKNETLPEDRKDKEEAKGFDSQLAEVDTAIQKLRDEAETATSNYNAKEELNDYIIAQKVVATITEAEKNVEEKTGKEENAGKTFFLSEIARFNTTLDGITAEITKAYDEDKAVAQQAAIKNKVDELLLEVKGVAAKADANHKNNEALQEEYKAITNEWSKVFSDISHNNMTSLRNELLRLLNLEQINYQNIKAEIDNAFANGQINDEKKIDFSGELKSVQNEISDIASRQNTEYNEQVAKENRERKEAFEKAWENTSKKLAEIQSDVRDLQYVQNPLYRPGLIELVNEATVQLYDYTESLSALQTKADFVYKEALATPLALFDYEENFLKEVGELDRQIETTKNDFIAKANESLKGILFGTEYRAAEAALSGAKADIYAEYYDEDIRNTAFATAERIIKNVNDQANDIKLAAKLDYIIAKLETVPALLEADKEEATVTQWNRTLSATDKKLADEAQTIATAGYLNEGIKQDFIDRYAEVAEAWSELKAEVEPLTVLFPAYIGTEGIGAQAKAIFDNADAIYKEAKNASENNTENLKAYEHAKGLVATVEGEFNTAYDFVTKFIHADRMEDNISSVEDHLNRLAAIIEEDKKVGSANKRLTFYGDECAELSRQIKTFYYDAVIRECDGLTIVTIDQVKQDYNLAAAAVGTASLTEENKAIEAFADRIAEIKDAFSKNELTSANAQTQLLGIESEMAALRTKLTNIYKPEYIGELAAKLQTGLDAVKTATAEVETTLSECATKVQELFTADLEDIQQNLATIQALLDNASEKDAVLFYSESISDKTAEQSPLPAKLAEEIAKAQEPYTIDSEARTRLATEIAALQEQLDNLVATDESYENASISEETIKGIQERIDAETKALAEHTGLYKEDASLTDPNIGNTIANELSSITVTEYGKQIETFYKDLNEYSFSKTEYLPEIHEELVADLSKMKDNLSALQNYHNNILRYGYTDHDIYGNELEEILETYYMSVAPQIKERLDALQEAWALTLEYAEENRYVKGDLDGDRDVLVTDYNLLLNVVLRKATIEEGTTAFYAADVNNDGKINIGDVAALVNKILEDQSAAYLSAMPASETGTDALSLAVENEGGIQRIAVSLSSAANTVGLQMDIKLPAGMMIMGETLGESLSAHQIYSNDLGNGTHRIVIASLGNAALPGSNSPIFYLDVNSTEKASQIALGEVLLTNAAAQVRSIGSQDGQTTGIQGIENDKSSLGTKIYDLGGRLMNSIKQGIHIIRKADGSSEKVMGE